MVRKYRDYLTNSENISRLPLDLKIADQAVELRSQHNFKTPDAIQLDTAVACGADDIKTNDKDWQRFLDDKDRAMLAFVMKAIKTPDAVEKQDVDQLHDLGWTDSDIMDAMAHGTNMIGSSILMKTFKMDQKC